jgi:membrane protein DedA with SNARE-associated domain
VQHFIVTAGYLAIFVLMVAESACVPVPSEVTMPLGGALAAGAVSGAHLNIVWVVVVGTVGNVAGSYAAWAVGRYAGPPVLNRWGARLRLSAHDLQRAQRWFDRHGAASVFFGRLLPVVRTFISLPAGFAAMRPLRFGAYTLAGCLPWTLALAWIGYALGQHWNSVSSALHWPTYLIAGVVVVALVVAVVLAWRRRGRESRAAEADGRDLAAG